MSQTPEGKVKDRVKKLLNWYGIFTRQQAQKILDDVTVIAVIDGYYHCPVVNGMGEPTLDFIGCYRGKFFAIETKAHDKQMTDQQELTAQVMREAGGAVFLINDETGVEPLKQWLEESK
jgi:penicillin-binding protein-related factor A (putative recombinase)